MQSKKKEGESDLHFFLKNVGQASFSAMFAEFVTIPADTAKVRMQIQKVAEGEAPRYKSMYQSAKLIGAEEGVTALWGGIIPGL